MLVTVVAAASGHCAAGRAPGEVAVAIQVTSRYGPAGHGARRVRVWAPAVVFAVPITSCGGEDTAETAGNAERSGPSAVAVELPQAPPSPREDVPAALTDPNADGLPAPLVDTHRLLSGGPAPDGIPAIDRPRFLRATDVDFLDPVEPVLGLELGGEERAYPVQILIWHEIVNDTVGGIPVAVTYCPLCNSALAFDRRAAGRVLDFGTSGMLYNSDLVMYDRQTRSLWPQIEGRAVAGVLTGTSLTPYVISTVSWGEWRAAHPGDWVLSRDTGHTREYGRNPYTGYDQPDGSPFAFDGDADPRLPPMTRVVGLGAGADAVAVALDRLAAARVMEVTVAGESVVLFARPGLASALDTADIARGREVAATGAFTPMVDGRRLSFQADGDRFVDAQTGTRWNVLGEATEGPLRGKQLKPERHVDTFWFAWAAFQPDTRLIQ
ncbi:MAG TPA: DUF3179 domain-containing protein [Actinomycetes bacterium]